MESILFLPQSINLKCIPDALEDILMDQALLLACGMDDTAPIMTQSWMIAMLSTPGGEEIIIKRYAEEEELWMAAFLQNK